MTLGNVFKRASKNHAFQALAGVMLSTQSSLFGVFLVILKAWLPRAAQEAPKQAQEAAQGDLAQRGRLYAGQAYLAYPLRAMIRPVNMT